MYISAASEQMIQVHTASVRVVKLKSRFGHQRARRRPRGITRVSTSRTEQVQFSLRSQMTVGQEREKCIYVLVLSRSG